MKYVSFTYDPIGNTPFSMSVYEEGKLSKYGFYEPGKEWAEKKNAQKPEWMYSTTFFEVSEDLVLSVINSEFDDFEIKSIINKKIIQNQKHSFREKTQLHENVKKTYPMSRNRSEIVSFLNTIDYRALSFLSDQKKKSPICQIKREISSSKSENIITASKVINSPEVKSSLGRGQARRLNLTISSFNKKDESASRRAIRRADNIAGIEYEDISDSGIRNRILNSSLERLRRF